MDSFQTILKHFLNFNAMKKIVDYNYISEKIDSNKKYIKYLWIVPFDWKLILLYFVSRNFSLFALIFHGFHYILLIRIEPL